MFFEYQLKALRGKKTDKKLKHSRIQSNSPFAMVGAKSGYLGLVFLS